ncbi:MAG: VIT1/CCC1 transporter family protein [Firmicutes bacterium]|nr:VIT1/CCC1 transporter family protein [Bacillota bacterium]
MSFVRPRRRLLGLRRLRGQSRSASAARPSHSGLIREAIFGINDGLVATIGLVSGEALSHQAHGAIIIAGCSAVGAAIVSMAVGSFLATQSENDFMRKEIRDQAEAIQQHPHRERHHVARLLDELGVPDEAVPVITRRIVQSRPRWLKFMAREHLGIHEKRTESPLTNAWVMGTAVLVGSLPPLLPYLLPLPLAVERDLSWALSLFAAFTLGAVKARLTRTSVVTNALSFGVLVSLSAAVGAGIGLIFGIVGA